MRLTLVSMGVVTALYCDIGVCVMPILKTMVLLIPRLGGRDNMKTLVELVRESTRVVHAGWNNYGLLYQVEGDTETLHGLIDLGCMEWV